MLQFCRGTVPMTSAGVGGHTGVRQARRTPGCLDFSIGADLLDPSRIGIFERWQSRSAADAFRGSGPTDEQQRLIVRASVSEYDVGAERRLT